MSKKGFTLIELLVVVIVVGVLTSVALPQYRKSMDRAKAAEAQEILPALFEARERWMILNGYTWDNGKIVDSSGNQKTLTMKMLDIEIPGTRTETGLQTKNFDYTLVAGVGNQSNQACVKAVPRWGASRSLTSAAVWYRGDKLSCNGGSAVCSLLNISEDGPNGSFMYGGCN